MSARMTRTISGLAALALSVSLSGCGLGESNETAEVSAGSIDEKALDGVELAVGSKDFDEQLILGQITLLALKAAGAEVTDRTNIQGSTATRQALLGSDIDVYWDYTGTGWINYLKHDKPITDAQEQYEAVRDEDLKENGLVWGTPAPLNNTYAMAVTDEFADETGVASLSDMAELSKSDQDQVTVCVESEFSSRPDGLPGMLKHYGMDVPSSNIKKFGVGVVYTQLDQGESCNFGEVFTTDGRIKLLDLVVMEDDKAAFPQYNAAPTMRVDFADKYPEIAGVLNPISAKLNNDVMLDLNARVDGNGEDPAFVARDWLADEGFISAPEG